MIKVFTSPNNPQFAGNDLTSQFEKWVEEEFTKKSKGIIINDFQTKINRYVLMLTIHYSIKIL